MKKKKIIIKLLIFPILAFIIFNVGMYLYCLWTPKLELNKTYSYYMYDNKNELVGNFNDEWVPLNDISPYLVNATLWTEDKHFYKHFGFDYLRILKAAWTNVISGSKKEGASTITQQYARNLFLSFDKTWQRKIEEAKLAFEIEVHYTKDEILEGYLNTINYGGVFGIENASKYYFNKSSHDLTLAEASILAGIPKSPMNYSPLINEVAAKKRQKIILSNLYENKIISKEEMDTAYETELTYHGKKSNNDMQSVMYYKDAVLKELETIPNIPNSIIETGGLKIWTTLDTNAQRILEDSVEKNMVDTDMQVASVVMNPNTGEVLALMGGTNYNKTQFNRAISSKRQIGSTMKPFLYYAALENGFTVSSKFTSERTTFTLPNNQTYSPKNYNDKYPDMPITMAAAVSYSDNIYAVKTHLFLGEENLVNIAKRVGISTELDPIPSLALGSKEISMLELLTGYSCFANEGYKIEPHFIKKITDNNGNILYEYKDDREVVLNRNLTFIVNEMLTYTHDYSFSTYGTPTLLNLSPLMTRKYAVKSGTTSNDYWIVGYNKDLIVGVWNGYDNISENNVEVKGSHKEIWLEVMEEYLKDKTSTWYDMPSNVVGVLVDPVTGTVVTEPSSKSKIFYYIKGTEPYYDENNMDKVFKEN